VQRGRGQAAVAVRARAPVYAASCRAAFKDTRPAACLMARAVFPGGTNVPARRRLQAGYAQAAADTQHVHFRLLSRLSSSMQMPLFSFQAPFVFSFCSSFHLYYDIDFLTISLRFLSSEYLGRLSASPFSSIVSHAGIGFSHGLSVYRQAEPRELLDFSFQILRSY
jgi:hypothetical protein